MGKSAKIAIATIMLVLIAGGIYWAVQANSVEGQARKAVDKYVKAVKYRESTLDLTYGWVDDPIDVIDYEYLRKVSEEQKPRLLTLTRQEYADYFSKQFTSYEEYIEWYKRMYTEDGAKGSIISDRLDETVIDTGDTYTEIKLLYDMELVNGAGQQVHKKVVVAVVDRLDEMQVSDFDIE